MNGYTPVINKQRSFLSTAAWGVSMVIISVIAGATLTAGYALNIVDRKTGNAIDFVAAVVDGVPEFHMGSTKDAMNRLSAALSTG